MKNVMYTKKGFKGKSAENIYIYIYTLYIPNFTGLSWIYIYYIYME